MRCLIVGGSVAGRSVACLLKDLPGVQSIKLIEASSWEEANTTSSQLKLYTGIWGPSLEILHRYIVPKTLWSRMINPCLQPVSSSGYRSAAGSWLLKPTVGLQPPLTAGQPASLAFINNKQLLDVLTLTMASSDLIRVQYNTVIAEIKVRLIFISPLLCVELPHLT
jgi:2-polyprenyl-6-methoxyphenol hydroxylase-like FAD-dependent oxidoreductase